jgi:hypothetical protein
MNSKPVRHHALLGDAVDPVALGIDQGHVGTVEGRQIFVVEAGTLAHQIVPRLQ